MSNAFTVLQLRIFASRLLISKNANCPPPLKVYQRCAILRVWYEKPTRTDISLTPRINFTRVKNCESQLRFSTPVDADVRSGFETNRHVLNINVFASVDDRFVFFLICCSSPHSTLWTRRYKIAFPEIRAAKSCWIAYNNTAADCLILLRNFYTYSALLVHRVRRMVEIHFKIADGPQIGNYGIF